MPTVKNPTPEVALEVTMEKLLRLFEELNPFVGGHGDTISTDELRRIVDAQQEKSF